MTPLSAVTQSRRIFHEDRWVIAVISFHQKVEAAVTVSCQSYRVSISKASVSLHTEFSWYMRWTIREIFLHINVLQTLSFWRYLFLSIPNNMYISQFRIHYESIFRSSWNSSVWGITYTKMSCMVHRRYVMTAPYKHTYMSALHNIISLFKFFTDFTFECCTLCKKTTFLKLT